MIQLTDARTGKPIWLNIDYIAVMRADDTRGTLITMAQPKIAYWVQEGAEEIQSAIYEVRFGTFIAQ